MKILMINHFPLAGSGSGTYTKNLAVHLTEAGHEVCIIFPENTENYDKIEGVRMHPVYFTPEDGSPAPEGALSFNFPCFTTHPRSHETFAGLSEEQFDEYMLSVKSAIDEEVGAWKPDVVHGQHVWVLPYLAIDTGLPMVVTAHGTDLMGYDRWPQFRKYADAVMEYSKAVISISKDNFLLLEQMLPGYKDKVVMMRNGYDPSVFYPERLDQYEVLGRHGITAEEIEYARIISFAGKLTRFKGVDILLDAMAIYEDKEPKSLTLIIGDGEEMDSLRNQASNLGLKSVRFLGNVDQNELRRLYNAADFNLVPSRREAFGLVAIEAMGCGIPVIATNEGGLPDFVNDEVGALVNPEDPNDLARKILEMQARLDRVDVTAWRQEIYEYARNNYAQDKIIGELVELYDAICEQS